MPTPVKIRLPAALLASLALSACSGGGGKSPPPDPPAPVLPSGMALDVFLPLHDGDVYEMYGGEAIRITKANHRDFGYPSVMRLSFDDRVEPYGLFVSHGDKRGSLLHGAFDARTDEEIVFRTALPMWGGLRQNGRVVEFDAYAPANATKATGVGTARLSHVFPDRYLLPPHFLNYSTPFGFWLTHQLLAPHWKLEFLGPSLRRNIDWSMLCGPGFGPLGLYTDDRTYSVERLRRPGAESEHLMSREPGAR